MSIFNHFFFKKKKKKKLEKIKEIKKFKRRKKEIQPEQVKPFPENPDLQVQLKLPIVFEHVALE